MVEFGASSDQAQFDYFAAKEGRQAIFNSNYAEGYRDMSKLPPDSRSLFAAELVDYRAQSTAEPLDCPESRGGEIGVDDFSVILKATEE